MFPRHQIVCWPMVTLWPSSAARTINEIAGRWGVGGQRSLQWPVELLEIAVDEVPLPSTSGNCGRSGHVSPLVRRPVFDLTKVKSSNTFNLS